MRTLAIGDIHGCSIAFDTLLDEVRPRAGDTLVLLGDYVDRGPDSSGIIERILRLSRMHGLRLVCLRGNHEQLMLDARHHKSVMDLWMRNGGDATLASYSCFGDPGCINDIPVEHWDLLEKRCVGYFETPTHFFVHANVLADLPLSDQPAGVMQWERFQDPRPHISGKTMICGHTIQRTGYPQSVGHAICIDTGVFQADGWLTCLEVGTGRIWQSGQAGVTRNASVAESLPSWAA